jgi:hypothetical protein
MTRADVDILASYCWQTFNSHNRMLNASFTRSPVSGYCISGSATRWSGSTIRNSTARTGKPFVPLSKHPRPPLRATQPPIQCYRASFLGAEGGGVGRQRPRCNVDHSPLCPGYKCVELYAFMPIYLHGQFYLLPLTQAATRGNCSATHFIRRDPFSGARAAKRDAVSSMHIPS